MDILSSLNLVVDYIENHVCDEISIAELAKSSALNEYELSNLFHSLTGVTIKEYIRRRRLTLAALELKNNDCKIIDIAVKYGYDSADSFRRAFVRQHGVAPSLIRQGAYAINIYQPLSFKIRVEGVDKMNFKIVNVDELTVYGVSKACFSSGNQRYEFARKMWDEKCDNVPSQICDGYDGIWYAIWSNNSYSIARDKSNCTNSQLEKIVVSSGQYAVFTTESGGYAGDELPKLHDQIFNSWLQNSEYERALDLELEVYHLNTDRAQRRKKRYYEIWIPVKKKCACKKASDLSVRRAELSDAEAISQICENDLGYKCSTELVASKLSRLADERESVFVSVCNGKVSGFVHIEMYDTLYCETGTNILGLAVASEYRRKNAGTMLMNIAENWAKNKNASFVRLNSGSSRKEAHSFYRHIGYDNEKEQKRFIKNI